MAQGQVICRTAFLQLLNRRSKPHVWFIRERHMTRPSYSPRSGWPQFYKQVLAVFLGMGGLNINCLCKVMSRQLLYTLLVFVSV